MNNQEYHKTLIKLSTKQHMNDGDYADGGDVDATHIIGDHDVLTDISLLYTDTFSTRSRVH